MHGVGFLVMFTDVGTPWNNWFHCTAHVYGAWLRGDPRGWRTRHHREHVEGDYKHPPKREDYEKLQALSRRLMKHDRVRIHKAFREHLLSLIIERLLIAEIECVCASLNSSHLHVLARFNDRNPRHWIGRAKYHASMGCKGIDGLPQDGLWGKRSKAEPVKHRTHQVKTFKYILDHRNEGAHVYVKTKAREVILPPLKD
jgi:hypothetical protein